MNEEYKKLTPFKLCVLQNFPYIEEDFDALTNYGLMCKIVEYLNNVINNENIVESNVSELQTQFITLKNHVDNYFDNLDVQEEINNKLDEMAQSGVLTELISQYLTLKTLLCFDTINDMKTGTNLVNGSFARTYGYNTVNDGGGALYKIRNVTNQDVENDMDIVALNNPNLVAEFVSENGVLNIKQFGCIDDGVTNNATKLQNCINYSILKGLSMYVPSGDYNSDTRLTINGDIKIYGNKNSNLMFTNVSECLVPKTSSTVSVKDVNITNDKGIAYNMNQPYLIETNIESNVIDSAGYGILVNNNTDNGEDLKITNNTIIAGSDAIEINTTHYNDEKFKNIVISDNILATPLSKNPTNPSTAGFCVGIATGKNITVTGNVIKESRREGIHIEDGSENITVTGNIIDNCHLDGILVYANNTKNLETHNISNNTISSNKTNTNTNGIYYTNTSNGQIREVNISNNIIKGFTTAFRNGSTDGQIINADGLICKDCERFIVGSAKTITGHVLLDNTPIIGEFNNSRVHCSLDRFTFYTEMDDNWLKVGDDSSVSIKGLNYEKKPSVGAGGGAVPMMKVPTYFKDIYIDVRVQVSSFTAHAIYIASYNSTDGLTATKIYQNAYGSISLTQLSVNDDGMLCAGYYNASASNPTFRINIDGEMLFHNYNQ